MGNGQIIGRLAGWKGLRQIGYQGIALLVC
jgi:hypothetical protein